MKCKNYDKAVDLSNNWKNEFNKKLFKDPSVNPICYPKKRYNEF